MGLAVLPQGALTDGIQKAQTQLALPELPMYALAVFTDETTENDVRDVFIRYLESELNNLK